MIRVSREVTVVADSSKFDRRSLSVIAGLGDVDRLITDHRANPTFISALRAHDIDVTIV
jgi:DeoR/GlpR family transcriptional regulator of sugar metabolism